MIRRKNSDHSITFEGPKEDIDKFKTRLCSLLGISGPIGDNLFIELQSVFKAITNEEGKPLTVSLEEALQRQNKKPTYTRRCKDFLSALGNKEVEQIDLPKTPIGDLSFEEVKNKFGFEQDSKRVREFYINVPDELRETLKLVKKSVQPDDKQSRFSIKEDPADPKSIVYNFEITPDNRLKVRRYATDTDEEHFVYTTLRVLCFYQSKDSGPTLSLFKQRAASYLINSLSSVPDMPTNKIPEFHCELIDQDYEIPPVELFFKNPVKISVSEAMFLIEIFCENQEKKYQCNFNKEFLESNLKTIYLLSILAPLPVAFEYVAPERVVQLTFADISIASADFIFNQVKFAMGIFSKLPRFDAYFIDVDSIYWPSEKFITIHEKLGLAIIRSSDDRIKGDSATFYVWAFLNKPIVNNNLEQVNALREEYKTIYDEIKLYVCDQCDKRFSHGFGGECVLKEHTGVRVPFPETGEMVKVETVREGNNIYEMRSVFYTCCGEIAENEEGCTEIVFPHGHREKVNEKGEQILTSQYHDQINTPS